MDIRCGSEVREFSKEVEANASQHIAAVNDIYSYQKERMASLEIGTEGSVLCSSISILSAELKLSSQASSRILWTAIREWETKHFQLCETLKKRFNASQSTGRNFLFTSNDLEIYLEGVTFQMSGNEVWSKTTPRYHRISKPDTEMPPKPPAGVSKNQGYERELIEGGYRPVNIEFGNH